MPDTRLVLGSANFKSRPIVTPPFSNATNRGKHPNVARLGGHAVTRYSFDEGETV